MTPKTARCWMLAMACMSRIEGMKAENQQRVVRGCSMAYTEKDFAGETDELERLAIEVINE